MLGRIFKSLYQGLRFLWTLVLWPLHLAKYAVQLAVSVGIILFLTEQTRHTFGKKRSHPKHAPYVVVWNLEDSLSEAPLYHLFEGGRPTFFQTMQKLAHMEKNAKVVGLFVHLGRIQLSGAQIEDLRAAFVRLKQAGKKVWVHTAEFGTKSFLPYYLASVADRISMDQAGTWNVTGLGVEQRFMAQFLKDWHVKFHVFQRKEYKSFLEPYLRNSMSKPARQAYIHLLNNMVSVMTRGIQTHRKRTDLKEFLTQTPLFSDQALKHGWVDALCTAKTAYRDMVTEVKKSLDSGKQTLGSKQYFMHYHATPKGGKTLPVIAWFATEGPIEEGELRSPLFAMQPIIEAHRIIRILWKLEKEERVKSIILRIDSPGGGVLPSFMLLNTLKEMKKPVVVSMAGVTASGGYVMAMGGTSVLASPLTVTGSIGVIMGKINLEGAGKKWGFFWDRVATQDTVHTYSPYRGLTQEEEGRIHKDIDRYYKDFVSLVATSRKMSYDVAESLARGRVWTGHQAHGSKLVDHLGGYYQAIEEAKRLGDITGDDYKVIEVPQYPKKLWERLVLLWKVLDSPQAWAPSLQGLGRGVIQWMQRAAYDMPRVQ